MVIPSRLVKFAIGALSLALVSCASIDDSTNKPAALGLIATPASYYSTPKARYLGEKYKENLDRLVERIVRDPKTAGLQFANNIASVGGIGFFTHSATRAPDDRFLEVVLGTPETFEKERDYSAKVFKLFSLYGPELLSVLASDSDIYQDKEVSGYGLNFSWRRVAPKSSAPRVTMERAVAYFPKDQVRAFLKKEIDQNKFLAQATIFAVQAGEPMNLVSYRPQEAKPDFRPPIREENLAAGKSKRKSEPKVALGPASSERAEPAKDQKAPNAGPELPAMKPAADVEHSRLVKDKQDREPATPPKRSVQATAKPESAPVSPERPVRTDKATANLESLEVQKPMTQEPRAEPRVTRKLTDGPRAGETSTLETRVPKAGSMGDSKTITKPTAGAVARSEQAVEGTAAKSVAVKSRADIEPAGAGQQPSKEPASTAPHARAEGRQEPITRSKVSESKDNKIVSQTVPSAPAVVEIAELSIPKPIVPLSPQVADMKRDKPSESVKIERDGAKNSGQGSAGIQPNSIPSPAPVSAANRTTHKANADWQKEEIQKPKATNKVEPAKSTIATAAEPLKVERVTPAPKLVPIKPEVKPTKKLEVAEKPVGQGERPQVLAEKKTAAIGALPTPAAIIPGTKSPNEQSPRPKTNVSERSGPERPIIIAKNKPVEMMPEKKPPIAAAPKVLEGYIVQLSFNEKTVAQHWGETLERRGYAVSITSPGAGAFRVRIGNFSARDKAERQLQTLRKEGLAGIVVSLPQPYRPEVRSQATERLDSQRSIVQ